MHLSLKTGYSALKAGKCGGNVWMRAPDRPELEFSSCTVLPLWALDSFAVELRPSHTLHRAASWCFFKFSMLINHLGNLTKMQIQIRKPGVGPRFCLSPAPGWCPCGWSWKHSLRGFQSLKAIDVQWTKLLLYYNNNAVLLPYIIFF